jgi:putative transposase
MDQREKWPDRRSVRLPHFDYSKAATYFITLCVEKRTCLFGKVETGEVSLSAYGEIAQEEWLKSEQVRPNIRLDAFVVMPNHLHSLVVFLEDDPDGTDVGAHSSVPARQHCFHKDDLVYMRSFGGRETKSLCSFLACFKAITTKRINETRHTPGAKVWQRGFFERVIRNEQRLSRARQYILDNPAKWPDDRENPFRSSILAS